MDSVVADNQPAQLRLLERMMARLGHGCRGADSGEALLRECSASFPEVVVSDIDLGDMDGVEVCLGLRRRRPCVRIVLVTGSSAHAERARKAGFERVLLKPLSMEVLRDVLV